MLIIVCFVMIPQPPRATRTDTLLPYTTRVRSLSVGLLGNAAEILPEIVSRNMRPDIVTDQTSAHDVVNGYLPAGWTVEEWEDKRISNPKAVEKAARASIATHVSAMLDWWRMDVPVVDYGKDRKSTRLNSSH